MFKRIYMADLVTATVHVIISSNIQNFYFHYKVISPFLISSKIAYMLIQIWSSKD